MSTHHAYNNANESSNSFVPMTLERKLELLESRFTRPAGATLEASEQQQLQPLLITTAATAATDGSANNPFASQHSFSFDYASNHINEAFQAKHHQQPQPHSHQQSSLPNSHVRSRRRPSLHSSFHAVERATARHLRKVAANNNSPVQGTTSNLSTASFHSNNSSSRLSTTSSQQPLLTSHVQNRYNQHAQPPRIVAESPPAVPVTPGISTTPAAARPPPTKPGVARTLLPSRTTPTTTTTTSVVADMPGADAGLSTGTPSNTNGKRKSVPKRKHASIVDRSQLMTTNSNSNTSSSVGSTSSSTHPGAAVVSFGTSPEPPVRRGRPSTTTTTTAKTHYDDKSPVGGTSDASRERSNPAKVAYGTTGSNNNNSKKSLGPANNRSIHDFFSSSHKRTTAPGGGSAGGSGMDGNPLPSTTSHEEGKPDASSAATRNTSNLVGDVDQIDWAAKFQKLEQLLQDKEEQLKAVTNNKTILHTALQSALEKTKHELEAVKSRMNDKTTAMGTVLEDLLRWKSNQQAKDLRETLATDGARLGRIVYARAGMRALESWEEGYATRDLEHRKLALVAKREALEERSKQVEAMENRNTFEGMEAREAIRMHFENLRTQEADLSKDEESLNDEKGAHIRALKRVASEDASRFRHRPKLHDRYVLHCLLGKGGFSEVWRAYDLVELREVAVKIHQLDPRWPDSKKENYTKHVSREYEIHRNVRHARIVSLYDVFEIDNNSFATVLECCKGTDLDTLLKSKRRLPERQARALLLQILSGMNYLSQPSGSRQGIIHYDLKPGNILFDEFGDAKITDFGLSKIVDTQDSADSMELTSQGAGTYWYLPPECFITNERVRISNKVDVWSIGVIYYQMLYGARPFGEGQSQDKLLSDHTMLNAHQVHFPEKPEISQEGKAFIGQCLMYDQAFRPTIAQLCEQPYVVHHTFGGEENKENV